MAHPLGEHPPSSSVCLLFQLRSPRRQRTEAQPPAGRYTVCTQSPTVSTLSSLSLGIGIMPTSPWGSLTSSLTLSVSQRWGRDSGQPSPRDVQRQPSPKHGMHREGTKASKQPWGQAHVVLSQLPQGCDLGGAHLVKLPCQSNTNNEPKTT